MAVFIQVVGLAFIGWVIVRWFPQQRRRKRQRYIDDYRFHPAIRKKLQDRHPQLSEPDTDLVFECLRDYFRICNLAGKRMVSMPSQVVDDAWHEFILFTRAYQRYCQQALGRFLHHVPAEAMRTPTLAQDGIKRAWKLACHLENINPRQPERLPQLFAIDSQLNIRNGFRYSLNCADRNAPHRGDSYCASHIGCSSGCGGGCSGDSSGDSSGCGGGCGGGGD
ncbi:MAG: hypothetical protein R3F38_08170 [Gammaproteobacteria bacterium]